MVRTIFRRVPDPSFCLPLPPVCRTTEPAAHARGRLTKASLSTAPRQQWLRGPAGQLRAEACGLLILRLWAARCQAHLVLLDAPVRAQIVQVPTSPLARQKHHLPSAGLGFLTTEVRSLHNLLRDRHPGGPVQRSQPQPGAPAFPLLTQPPSPTPFPPTLTCPRKVLQLESPAPPRPHWTEPVLRAPPTLPSAA